MSSPVARAARHVLQAVGDGKGGLKDRVRPRLHHVVAADAHGVEPGHVAGAVPDDVRDDPHRRPRRIDVGVPGQVLLQDVVLDGAGQFRLGDPLLLGGHDEPGQDRQDRAVHRHRHGHLVEGDLVEEDLHVFDRVHGNTHLPDIAGDPGVVRVVSPVGGQIEGDGEPLLPGGEVLPVEGIRFPGGGETGVLADRPGPAGVHRGNRTADVGGKAGEGVYVLHPLEVLGRVKGLDQDPLRGHPVQ